MSAKKKQKVTLLFRRGWRVRVDHPLKVNMAGELELDDSKPSFRGLEFVIKGRTIVPGGQIMYKDRHRRYFYQEELSKV